ncbi:MAG: SDR family oxidoreductase [Micromonosporaceae bacterium]|jgi:3-oxoacyl-[acyl-carrier protein] reductase|nr:SDR family oxidoreductase [Micromonosporaceae bacterium]
MPRVILITGGSSGIGYATAARFSADAAEVIITGRRRDTLMRAAAELGARGVVCDATDPIQVADLAEQVGDTVDVLVNAAGGLATGRGDAGTRLEALVAQWQESFAQNMITAALATAAVWDKFAPGGSVISIGSIGAERRGGAYGAAKAALAAWNASISAELGPRGVTTNVVSAGYVAGTNFFQGGMTEERHNSLVAETRTGRAGTPADIAEVIYFLASPGARHITGQTIHVNGGAFTTR